MNDATIDPTETEYAHMIDDTENLYPPAGHPDAVPCTPEETEAYEAEKAQES